MLSKYTKGNLEVLQGFISRRISDLEADIEETKDDIAKSRLSRQV